MILQTCGVSYSYDGANRALVDVNLAVRQGRRLALLGANGSGKTTLLLHLNGTLRPESGIVKLSGEPVNYGRSGLLGLRQRAGLVFQDPDDQLFAATVKQDISFGPMNLGLPEEEIRVRVAEAMETLEIAHLADRPPHMLSYGQKKLAAIAGVLAMRPDVIVLDEPTAGLDANSSARLLLTLDRLYCRGVTLIIATHDIDMAYAWADEVALMHGGAIVKQGAADDVFSDEPVLAEAGLRRPWVMNVAQALNIRARMQNECIAPRSLSGIVSFCRGIASRAVPEGEVIAGPCLNNESSEAILLVAFGSTIAETRRTFAVIEEDVCRSFPESGVFWAFTSRTVLRHHREKGAPMLSPQEALDRLNMMGYKKVVIQSLHIMPGEEYKSLLALDAHGMSVAVGKPLLNSEEDINEVCAVLKTVLRTDRANVIAGHGNEKHPELNAPILALAERIEAGRADVVVATIDGPPGTEAFARIAGAVKRAGAVHFVPLMMVSGIHVADDIMGDDEGSWRRMLAAAEASVTPSMGEMPGIRAVLVRHIREALEGEK